MGQEYAHLLYETDGDGITTITLNRPERMNAFNRKMSGELVLALDRFAHGDDEKVLVLTGAGRAFSTGEDLRNINLGASDMEIREYAKEALRDYHNIVRAILLTGKPIVAMLNGIAAGAGLSIALACDERYALTEVIDVESGRANILVPAFADMGLVADAGMTATLSRLVGRQEAQKWCEMPGKRISIVKAISLKIIDSWLIANFPKTTTLEEFLNLSPVAYAFSKELRNNALIYKLNKRVFPWELRAQTICLQSDYFKEKARAFLGRQKVREAK